jgi:hypothetical protein
LIHRSVPFWLQLSLGLPAPDPGKLSPALPRPLLFFSKGKSTVDPRSMISYQSPASPPHNLV